MIYEDDEIYKIIGDFPNYAVSTYGRVINITKEEFMTPHLRNKKKPEKTYYCVTLSNNNMAKKHNIHSLVAKAFIENPENYNSVDHIDYKQKFNNHISNLRWANYFMQAQNRGNTINARNIFVCEGKNKPFTVQIKRNNKLYKKCFKTEAEAIIYRDRILAQLSENNV